MNKGLKILTAVILFTAVMVSCKKETGPLSDLKPAIAVTVSNAEAFRPDPTVTASISGGGAIKIILNIPAGSGRAIKEITNVVANTSYTAVQATGGSYVPVPIAGSGTSVTFNTTLAQYFTVHPVSASNPAAAANTELARRFYFAITLDDNSVVISTPVRILVLP
jgi:hypothetical protein